MDSKALNAIDHVSESLAIYPFVLGNSDGNYQSLCGNSGKVHSYDLSLLPSRPISTSRLSRLCSQLNTSVSKSIKTGSVRTLSPSRDI